MICADNLLEKQRNIVIMRVLLTANWESHLNINGFCSDVSFIDTAGANSPALD